MEGAEVDDKCSSHGPVDQSEVTFVSTLDSTLTSVLDIEEVELKKLVTEHKSVQLNTLPEQNECSSPVIRKYRRYFSYNNTRFNYTGDVEVWVYDTVFQAHAAILREGCGYFKELLSEHWCGIPNSANVQHFMAIDDTAVTPITFKVILDYLYFGRMYITLDKIEEVYIALEFLDVQISDEDMVTDFSLSGIQMDLTGEEKNNSIVDIADSDSGKQSSDREGASSFDDDFSEATNTTATEMDFDSDTGADSAISVETPRNDDDLEKSGDFTETLNLFSDIVDTRLKKEYVRFDKTYVALRGGVVISDEESSVDTILSGEKTRQKHETETQHIELYIDEEALTEKDGERNLQKIETQNAGVQTDITEFEEHFESRHLQGHSTFIVDEQYDCTEEIYNELSIPGECITKTELLQLQDNKGRFASLQGSYPQSLSSEELPDDDDDERFVDRESVVEFGELSSARFAGRENEFVQLVRFLKTEYKVGLSGWGSLSRATSVCSSRASGSFRLSRFDLFASEEWATESLHEEEGTIRREKAGHLCTSTRRGLAESKRKEIICEFAEILNEYGELLTEDDVIADDTVVEPNKLKGLTISAVFVRDGSQSLCCYDQEEKKWKMFDGGSDIWRLPGRRWFSNDHRIYCFQYVERSPVFQRKILFYDCKSGRWDRSIPSFITTCSLSVVGILADSDDVIYVLEGGVTDNSLTVHIFDPNVPLPSWDIKLVPTIQLKHISKDQRIGIETDLVQFQDVCHSQGRFYFLYVKYRDPTVYLGFLQPPDELEPEWSAQEVMKISEHYCNETWKLIGDEDNLYTILINPRRIVIMKILPVTCTLLHIDNLNEKEDSRLFSRVKIDETKRWASTVSMGDNYINICNYPSSSHVCRYDLIEHEWSSVPLPQQDSDDSVICVNMTSLHLTMLPEVLHRTEKIPRGAVTNTNNKNLKAQF